MKKIDALLTSDVHERESIKEISHTIHVINYKEDEDTIIEEEEDCFDKLLSQFVEKELEEISNEYTNIDYDLDTVEDDGDNIEESANDDEDTNGGVEDEMKEDEDPNIEERDYEDDGNWTNKSCQITFEQLTGLKSVKTKLTIYEKLVRFNKLRNDRGLPSPLQSLHAMFLGSPGTGKTTVAKMMGKLLNNIGVLSKAHVVIKERSSLMGQNYGSEEENTRKAIAEAQGGILFIDEAYQLYQPNDPRDRHRNSYVRSCRRLAS